ncbi:MAG: DNA (cytosine-5-)-methyltransferase [Patescibacteria group bacterium]|nr:DNA (cytosine-5-)-methyltransferase [Patescibacteria group bacterium]
MIPKTPLTYISLFSGAGVGCYGFKLENFECVASVEFIERRLKIQKHNNKCFYENGYITDDIIKKETKDKIRKELEFWKIKHGIKELDILIATPPCQGMSVANHKKGNELARNSLVVESIKLVDEIRPKFFIFENVRAFLNSLCTDIDGKDKKIRETIELNLGGKYNIHYQIINFKDYGNPSSRTRTLVLGVRKDLQEVTPLDFIPALQPERTIHKVIGDLPSLKMMGEVQKGDIYHNFRPYAKRMLPWIEKIKEGESAFDNKEPERRPHKIINGKIVPNIKKNGDKYTRCFWDKPGTCVHTRNDILASQATVHPVDNRVFSIRELMKLMSVPNSFKWTDIPEKELNNLTVEQKRKFLKKEEMNIRQSLGEAVPTSIFNQIAKNIKTAIQSKTLGEKDVEKLIASKQLSNLVNLKVFLKKNLENYSFSELTKIIELANAHRFKHAAYYTRQDICFTIIKDLPDASNYSSVRILEPSVGAGNFLPLLIEKYKSVPNVEIDVVDIDKNAIDILKILIRKLEIPQNIKINFLNEDFLLFGQNGLFANEDIHYDIVVGNPPFGKLTDNNTLLSEYKKGKNNKKTNNLFSFFLEKAIYHADIVALIIPKSFLSTPEFNDTRKFVSQFAIEKIIDYGEKGFRGVKIETISLIINTKEIGVDNRTLVESYIKNEISFREQNYICSQEFPYWLVYRDNFFDNVASKLRFGIFTAYRDRQITKKITRLSGRVRVLKSRNIGSNQIVNIPEYDSYVDRYDDLVIAKYINHNDAVLIPNLTYNPRACFLPENTIVDGSVAILIPKEKVKITEKDLAYYNSEEFVEFYRVARNYGTRSLNIDNNSVFFFGVRC